MQKFEIRDVAIFGLPISGMSHMERNHRTKKSSSSGSASRAIPAVRAVAHAPAVAGAVEAYGRFLDEARAVDPDAVIPFRADIHLAHHNVRVGLDAVLAHEEAIRTRSSGSSAR